jgi:hypothetical protein
VRESTGAQIPEGAAKAKAPPRGGLTGDPGLERPGAAGGRPTARSRQTAGRTQSARVGTRKMVNYAWQGRSQGKLWWRPVWVLTCKSILKAGYRGERLIEPSSSWFPLKFPSG